MKRNAGRAPQVGVGLVEIMIAMVIGLFIIGGLTQIFVSNKQGFRAQDAQGRLQESERLVSVLLSSCIGKAGFRPNAARDPASIIGLMPVVTGTNNEGAATDVLNGTDTITIRFQGDGVMTDCLGASIADGDVISRTYRVDDNNELEYNNAANAFQAIINNVENMQVLYGEDSDSNGSVDRYVNAAAAGLNFNNVLSVHVAVLLASDGDVRPAADRHTYNLLDTDVPMPPVGEDPDRIQRRVVERVVSLRNRLR